MKTFLDALKDLSSNIVDPSPKDVPSHQLSFRKELMVQMETVLEKGGYKFKTQPHLGQADSEDLWSGHRDLFETLGEDDDHQFREIKDYPTRHYKSLTPHRGGFDCFTIDAVFLKTPKVTV